MNQASSNSYEAICSFAHTYRTFQTSKDLKRLICGLKTLMNQYLAQKEMRPMYNDDDSGTSLDLQQLNFPSSSSANAMNLRLLKSSSSGDDNFFEKHFLLRTPPQHLVKTVDVWRILHTMLLESIHQLGISTTFLRSIPQILNSFQSNSLFPFYLHDLKTKENHAILVGYIALNPNYNNTSNCALIEVCEVFHEWRNKKLGQKMVSQLEYWCVNNNIDTIYCEPVNNEAENFWKTKCGYQEFQMTKPTSELLVKYVKSKEKTA